MTFCTLRSRGLSKPSWPTPGIGNLTLTLTLILTLTLCVGKEPSWRRSFSGERRGESHQISLCLWKRKSQWEVEEISLALAGEGK